MITKKYVDKTLEGTESVPKGMVKVVEHQRDQFKTERDTLIDDLSWYKAKVSRLERENEKLKRENRRKHYSANENNKYYKELWNRTEEYRVEKEKLVDENTRLQNELYTVGLNQDEADDKVKECKSLLSEISQHIGNKPSSSTYKYFRAKLDGIGIKEGE